MNGATGGLRYREVVLRLRRFGFQFEREGAGSHEIWFNSRTERRVIVPKHRRAIAEGTLRSILRQAGIGVDDFLA